MGTASPMVVGNMVCITVCGVEIAVDFTAPAIAALMLLMMPVSDCGTLLLACIIHESAHLLVLSLCAVVPAQLRISGVGMRLDVPKAALCPLPLLSAILLSGAAANFIAAFVLFAMEIPDAAMVNASLGLFNLLPYRAADGGTLLYAWLEYWLMERHPQRLIWLWRIIWISVTAAIAICLLISGVLNFGAWGMLIFLVLSELFH